MVDTCYAAVIPRTGIEEMQNFEDWKTGLQLSNLKITARISWQNVALLVQESERQSLHLSLPN
jgi:hypothetical protein